jgi:hypothetical protein
MSEELTTIREQISILETTVGHIERKRTRSRLNSYLNSLLMVKENLIRLKRKLVRLPEIVEEDSEDISPAIELVDNMLHGIRTIEGNVLRVETEDLQDEVQTLRIEFSELSGSIQVEQTMFLVNFSSVPQEIREEAKLDFKEVRICYDSGAFRSAVSMCGRLLELLLAKKYYDFTGTDPIEQKWHLGQLIKKCFENGVIIDVGLGDICNFINHSRIASVHSSHPIHRPTQEETKSVIEFTISLLRQLYPSNSRT